MSVKDLYTKEAKDKIKEMAESINFAMMATDLKNTPFHTIPMSTKNVDDSGAIWFLSGKDSQHNSHINVFGDVHLTYSDPSSMEFLTVYGSAEIHTEKVLLEEFYDSTDDNWFDGVNDPNLTAIKVKPEEAHYWEPKSGKFVALLKMGFGAVTGKKPDVSKEGDLKV